MEEEKKDIIKPSWLFSTMLYVFMVFVIIKIINMFSRVGYFWDDALYPISIPLLLFAFSIDILAYFYSFLAIYKALQRKPYSITMLKFSVFYLLLQLFVKLVDGYNGIFPQIAWFVFALLIILIVLYISLLRASFFKKFLSKPYRKFFFTIVFALPVYVLCNILYNFCQSVQIPNEEYVDIVFLLFLIFFFIYLSCSNHLKTYIPKKNRKFGLMGVFGILIYVLVVTLYAFRSGEEIIKEKNSMPVEVADISLRNGELSDGMAAFTPLKEWKTDTVVGSEKEGMARIFHSDKCFNIFQTTVSIKCDNKIDYYQMLSECSRNQFPDSIALHEVLNRDSVIGGNKFYINSYKLQTDDFNGYWTFSALLDHSSYKIATLSCSEPDTLNASIKYVTQFMESVRFELNK